MSEIAQGKSIQERLEFTVKMMDAMKKYAERTFQGFSGGEVTGDPIAYEGRKFDGFLNVVVLEDGILCSGCNLGTEDLANILSSVGEGFKDKSPPGTKGRLLLGMIGAKFMSMAVEGMEENLDADTAKAVNELKKLLKSTQETMTEESSSDETKH